MKRFLITLAALVVVTMFASSAFAGPCEDARAAQAMGKMSKAQADNICSPKSKPAKKANKPAKKANKPAKKKDGKVYLEVPKPEKFVEVFENPDEFWDWIATKKMEDDGVVITSNNIGPIITRIFLWILGVLIVVGLVIFIFKMATKPWKVDQAQDAKIDWNSKNFADLLLLLRTKGMITDQDIDKLQDEDPS